MNKKIIIAFILSCRLVIEKDCFHKGEMGFLQPDFQAYFSFLSAVNMKPILFTLSTRKFPSFFPTMNILNGFQIRYEVNIEKCVSESNFI